MINSLRDKKADIEREISKVKNDLVAALDHKSFIMELAKELSTAMKAKGKKKKNAVVSESDSDFFITTAQEQEENEEEKEPPAPETPQDSQKEGLPMTKETLLELIVMLSPLFSDNRAFSS